MKLRVLFVAVAALLAAEPAKAALTTSEKSQVKDFVARAQLENVARVRSLVARTDLTQDESIAALTDAFAVVPFTEQRALFAKELLFGGASAASRPLLAHALVKALLGRADAVHQKYIGGLDHEPAAASELSAIYGFLDDRIANAGAPPADGHDPAAGIPSATYDDCSKAMRDHVEQNARWLKGDALIGEVASRVRAQAQTALLDLLPNGLTVTRRVDAADRLGLKGARRRVLLDWGVLLEDAGKLDDAAVDDVYKVFSRLSGATGGLEVLFVSDDPGPLRARGLVARVSPAPAEYPFGDEVSRGPWNPETNAIAYHLAVIAARRALEDRPNLRREAERDALAAQNDPGKLLGKVRAPSVDHALGSAMHLLVLDAPRAVDLALARLVAGRPESAALLSDAIGALASFARSDAQGDAKSDTKPADKGPKLDLGTGNGATTMKDLRLTPNGVAIGFSLKDHTWSLDRSAPSSTVAGAKRDGETVSLAHLATAQAPLRDGSSWSIGGFAFSKIQGAPRAGITPAEKGGPTVRLVGAGAKGYDAIGTSAPGDDFVVEGDLTVRGAPGGIAFRATKGREAVRGALLVVAPGGRTTLVTSDDAGAEAMLAAPIDPSPSTPVHVKITVRGTKVEAVLGGTTLNGTLPATMAKGEIGLVAKQGASVEVAGLSLRTK